MLTFFPACVRPQCPSFFFTFPCPSDQDKGMRGVKRSLCKGACVTSESSDTMARWKISWGRTRTQKVGSLFCAIDPGLN